MNSFRVGMLSLLPVFQATSAHIDVAQRQTTSQESVCGYENGNASQPRTANSGYDCRVDTENALWGFCPTTVISATDCGLAGYCIDQSSCSTGCGPWPLRTDITTFTW